MASAAAGCTAEPSDQAASDESGTPFTDTGTATHSGVLHTSSPVLVLDDATWRISSKGDRVWYDLWVPESGVDGDGEVVFACPGCALPEEFHPLPLVAASGTPGYTLALTYGSNYASGSETRMSMDDVVHTVGSELRAKTESGGESFCQTRAPVSNGENYSLQWWDCAKWPDGP